MSVLVIGLNGRPLMPTTTRKARILLKANKASVICRNPFTIHLWYKTGCATQEGSIGVDTGSQNIGIAVTAGSRGATDNQKYLASVCNACHTAAAHRPGGKLHQWMLEAKEFTRGLRDATFMNILRRRLFTKYPEAVFTYGNITAADRKRLLLDKSHANDAVAISLFGKDVPSVKGTCQTLHYRQVRRYKRSLHEANPRKGRKAPNTKAVRNAKNTSEVKGFHLWDTVKAGGKKLYITGFTGTAAYLTDRYKNYVSPPGKNYRQWTLSKITRLHPNGGWIMF